MQEPRAIVYFSSLPFLISSGIDISGPELFIVGQSASLTCSSDLHVNRLQWLLDGVTVTSSLAAQGELPFPVVGEELHGRDYVCQVTTPYGVVQRDRRVIAEGEH